MAAREIVGVGRQTGSATPNRGQISLRSSSSRALSRRVRALSFPRGAADPPSSFLSDLLFLYGVYLIIVTRATFAPRRINTSAIGAMGAEFL